MSHATLPASVLTKHQVNAYGPKIYTEGGETYKLTATVRYDDQCGNGHNSFGITGAQYRKRRNGTWEEDCFGCMHETIIKHFSELAPYIKWHLCSSDGPMHYLANTTYHAMSGNLDHARSTAIWPDATLEDLQDQDKLEARLPGLLEEFKQAVESLGFTF